MNTIKKILTTGLVTLTLGACGGGGSSSSDGSVSVNTGVFLDSAVKGLTYKTATQSGTTDANGGFKYKDGETVEFYLGTMKLGSAVGASTLYPENIDLSSTTGNQKGIPIARLLQTIDLDSNLDNGIDVSYITKEAIEYANQGGTLGNINPDIAFLYDNTPNFLQFIASDILDHHSIAARTFVGETDARNHLAGTMKKVIGDDLIAGEWRQCDTAVGNPFISYVLIFNSENNTFKAETKSFFDANNLNKCEDGDLQTQTIIPFTQAKGTYSIKNYNIIGDDKVIGVQLNFTETFFSATSGEYYFVIKPNGKLLIPNSSKINEIASTYDITKTPLNPVLWAIKVE